MTATNTVAFRIHPITADVIEKVRSSGVDAHGIPVEHVTAGGGEPLRCCLRNAKPGEQTMLFGYQLPLPPSPYLEVGPVFTHRAACDGLADHFDYPPDWRGTPQVLRAYDHRGWIHEATRQHDGDSPEIVITDVLADPAVMEIHSRNIGYGCYMFRITRASTTDDQTRS